MYGQCPYCHGNLTNGHNCRQRREAEAAMQELTAKSQTKLARMIRIWAAATGVEQAELAKAWGAAPSTVTRFLAGSTMPDGKTTARIIAWLMEP